ncbi:glycosyl hydrolase-related protein [Bifidobacterium sp. ESL0728]|uniref:alpha-mannosidase n=1 Tax=Bifidobacterium sp. ESL0728 TaxID=2983220 RepID=UPI0023F83EC6|nr:alpha-mannosidase [Bifidobacterium sp. ESL0728]WEV58525.1 glycosyl hydrolase-related protein [Bifidobacterium sp. ESL0728]
MFLKPQQQLDRCARVMRQRVLPHTHPVLESCGVRAFDIPGEPMPSGEFFAKVEAGAIDFKPFKMGSPWGTTWGTVWFELTGHVPMRDGHVDEGADGLDGRPVELMLDLGWYDHSPGGHIEGMVYGPDGTVVKAVHPKNFWVRLVEADGTANIPLADDGSFTLYLEAACNPLLLGVPPFVETNLGEKATGKPEEQYVFRSADVCTFDRQMEDYWLDLDVVSMLMGQADKDSPRYWQLAKALQRSLNVYDEQVAGSVVPARQALQGVLGKRANASAMDVSAVGHAHIDSAWLWPARETRRKVARTVSNTLALMNEEPDYIYAMSSAQQYAWLEEDHPDLFEQVKARVAQGRFVPVGGMWVEADGMVPTGESLIRQISYGQRYFGSRFGVHPDGVWLPDSFGYNGSWPQIARRAGYKWFLTQKISWSDTTKFPHHSFMWEGIDGTRIFTHFPPSDTYAAWTTVEELVHAEKNFQDKDFADKSILLYGWGDGGGGPTREMLGHLHRYEDLEGVSRVTLEAPDTFFEAAHTQLEENAGSEMPVWHGELYLELHRATLTSQQDMKRYCRQEESLLRVTEYLCAAATLEAASTGYVYPQKELDSIWKTLLLNQFHDILPGSGIAWVHREAREQYKRDMLRLKDLISKAAEALKTARPELPVVKEATITQYESDGSSWQVRPSIDDDEQAGREGIQPVTLQQKEDGSVVLDNGLLKVRVEPDGSVSSLIDIKSKRELVPRGTSMGAYELLKDEPSVYDAWEIERDALLCANRIEGGSITNVMVDGHGAVKVQVRLEFSHSVIDTDIVLKPRAARLDFHANVDWHERERFLKVDMPVALAVPNAQYECQYGWVERPVIKNDASDEAKYESCTHRYVRLHEGDYGVAVVNASTYGCDASPIHGNPAQNTASGTMLRLSLLESPVFPDPHEDMGKHEFDWAVLADATMARTLEVAASINAPKLQNMPAIDPLVSLGNVKGTPVIDWVKLADDGSGDLIVRLYEASGASASATLHVAAPLADATVCETDVLETNDVADDLSVCLSGEHPAQGAAISLNPFEMATLRFRRQG